MSGNVNRFKSFMLLLLLLLISTLGIFIVSTSMFYNKQDISVS